jgi:hypothetical protein
VSDRLALANAIEDAGIERAKAERVASVIFDAIHDNVATKADLQVMGSELKADVQAVRADVQRLEAGLHAVKADVQVLKTDVQALTVDVQGLRAEIALVEHRLLTRLGGLTVVLLGILFAALHYWPPGMR